MASSCVSAVAPNKIVKTVLNIPQGALRNFAPKFEAALNEIRASASDAASMKVVGTAAGELALTLD